MALTALVPLIEGFEEIEAIAVIDLLRRAGIEVIAAGVSTLLTTGSHKISVACDRLLSEVAGREFDIVVLPGGPATPQLCANTMVREIVRRHAERGKWVAAICAAPYILADLGLLEGRKAVCHYSVEAKMKGAILQTDNGRPAPVAVHGMFITSRGAGTAVLFALVIIDEMLGTEKMTQIASAICMGL